MAVQTEDKKLNGAGLTTLWGIIKQFFSSKQDKVSPLGSATKPVYISGDGTFGECDSYKDSTVKNIVGEFSDTGAEFAYRPSAGAVDIESGKADFGGHLETIKGNTVAWNQMVQNGDFADNSIWSANNATLTINGGVAHLVQNSSATWKGLNQTQFKFALQHKYYVKCNVRHNLSSTESCSLGTPYSIDGGSVVLLSIPSGSSYTDVCGFVAVQSDNDNLLNIKFITSDAIEYDIKNVTAFDLTLIYGAGNEPTTVEQFEADYQKWFGKPLTYEDYDEGSLRPVKMTGIKTVGFNVWDEEVEHGVYDTETGVKQLDPATPTLCSKNYMRVLPNTTYCYRNGNNPEFRALFYREDMSYIGFVLENNAPSTFTFTTPADTAYMAIYFGNSNNTYNHDICINLHHSGDKDGQYEPYWESQLNVPITSLKGKLNGVGSSVVVFPDGMKKAGTVYDEIVRVGNVTKAIKRVGSVDLGSLTWGYTDSFQTPISINPHNFGRYSLLNEINPFYPQDYWAVIDAGLQKDKTIYFLHEGEDIVRVYDSSFSDAVTFKTAMSGVMLYYELEEPEEYILDDFELPQEYDVDDWGTEEILLGTNGVAPVLDLKYGINAGDTIKNLPHNYVSINRQNFSEGQQAIARQNIGAASQEDMIRVKKQLEAIVPKVDNDYFVDMGLPSGLLWAKRNIDLSQANGFAASEYQYEGSFFSWGNTDGHNPTGNDSFGEYSFGTGNDTEPYVSSEGAKLTADITPSFDAARVNLGTPWRMPTSDDFAELFNSAYTKFIDADGNDIAAATTDKRITMNGIVGIRLKSKVNGNILFFACSGYGYGTSWSYRGSHGYYWSSSLNSATNGRNLGFYSGGIYPQADSSRFDGFSVRPVM